MARTDRCTFDSDQMHKAALAHNLAVSLGRGEWDTRHLSGTLARRLPNEVRHHAQAIAQSLIADSSTAYAPPVVKIAKALTAQTAFAQIHAHCARYNVWPAPDLRPAVMAPVGLFAALDLPSLPTTGDLANWLHVSPDKLAYFADPHARHETHGDTPVNHYFYKLHRKPKGGVRLIEAPKQQLKSIQSKILRDILDVVPPHPDSFGFVKTRNCIQSAARHAGEEVVVTFDLRHFFVSLRMGRVIGLFRTLGYPEKVANTLAALCTTRTPHWMMERLPRDDRPLYRDYHLAQGAPTSPTLANLLAFQLDRRLSGLARSLGAQYSRYADDMAFSGDAQIIAPLLRHVPNIAQGCGLTIHAGKTRVMRRGSCQRVTGLTVNSHVNVPRLDYDRLKATLHACLKPDDQRLQDPAFRAHLLGRINWVAAVNPAKGAKLWAKLEAGQKKSPPAPI